jgi:hypothetical protein
MATQKQLEANRRNAQKSTGPRTPQGKASVRLNALRHGLRARSIVLPGESAGDFEQLCDDLQAEWRPLTRTEQFYLEQMAVAQWKLRRMEVAESYIYLETSTAKEQLPYLDRLWQAQSRMERSFARAQRELERLQAAGEVSSPLDAPDQATAPPTPQPPSTASASGDPPESHPAHARHLSPSGHLHALPRNSMARNMVCPCLPSLIRATSLVAILTLLRLVNNTSTWYSRNFSEKSSVWLSILTE